MPSSRAAVSLSPFNWRKSIQDGLLFHFRDRQNAWTSMLIVSCGAVSARGLPVHPVFLQLGGHICPGAAPDRKRGRTLAQWYFPVRGRFPANRRPAPSASSLRFSSCRFRATAVPENAPPAARYPDGVRVAPDAKFRHSGGRINPCGTSLFYHLLQIAIRCREIRTLMA